MAAKKHEHEKIGDGHFEAWIRQGAAEMRNALYPDSNVAQRQAEYGIWGTRTPGEVADDRRMVDRDFDDEPHHHVERNDRAQEDHDIER